MVTPSTPELSLGDVRPLRLLFIGHEATRTGAPIALLRLMKWVRDNLHWPIVCVLQKGGELEDDFHALCPTTVADRGHWHTNSWRHRLLGRLGLPQVAPALNTRAVRRCIAEADVVYANTLDTTPTLRLLPTGKPLVSHVHELEYTIRSYIGTAEADAVLARSDRVIACARAVADNLITRHGVAPGRVDVVYEYIQMDAAPASPRSLRQELGIDPEAFVVGAAGVMCWRKGTDLFLQVAKLVQMQAKGREVLFVWLGGREGSPEHEQFLYDVRQLGIESQVSHAPARNDPETFYRGIDLFVLFSREDPYPLVCLEAASHGVPILCFAEAGGIPEFVGDDAGMIVPYLDLPAMAAAISRMREDRDLHRAAGDVARRKARTQHDVAQAAPKIIRSILAAVEDKR